jgi:hypothetical protein
LKVLEAESYELPVDGGHMVDFARCQVKKEDRSLPPGIRLTKYLNHSLDDVQVVLKTVDDINKKKSARLRTAYALLLIAGALVTTGSIFHLCGSKGQESKAVRQFNSK